MTETYTAGMEITFTPLYESNTGDADPGMAGRAVIEVPKWALSRCEIGQTISLQTIDGVHHWYIGAEEIFP